jgi:hypothetical protein
MSDPYTRATYSREAFEARAAQIADQVKLDAAARHSAPGLYLAYQEFMAWFREAARRVRWP